MKRILNPIKTSKAKVIKFIEEKISKTKNEKEKEKLKELEEAVKGDKKGKIKEILKDISSDVGVGLFEVLINAGLMGI